MEAKNTALLTAFLAALVTAIGWAVIHRSNRVLARRKDHLDLVNRQLAEFYGPLHVACEAGLAAFKALLVRMGNKQSIFVAGQPPTEAELKEWSHWMKHVLMPLNDLREKLILEKSHLIREDRVPDEILGFVGHVVTYRAIMAKWEEGDFSEKYSPIEFPEGLDEYARRSFAELKTDQARLIGLLTTRHARNSTTKSGIKPGQRPTSGLKRTPGGAA
jgi:hypothetical protein